MKRYRSLFFSDIHLGSYGSQSRAFLEFIKDKQFENIYIVGDFIDFWALKRKSKQWTQEHNNVLQKLLKKHRKGAACIWIVGNHDEFMAQFADESFGGIDIKLSDVHVTKDGKRYLIMHGHELDAVMLHARWMMHLGAWAYEALIKANHYYNKITKLFGRRYFSLSAYCKHRVKSAVNFIGDFEKGIVEIAKIEDVDGVICGHIHAAADKNIDGYHYLNTGDWVESLTAVVEHEDGRMEVVRFGA